MTSPARPISEDPPPPSDVPTRDPRWRERAACRGCDPALFYPGQGDNLTLRLAKKICDGCPVQADCLSSGMFENYGIWGAKSERERRVLRRKEVRVRKPRELQAIAPRYKPSIFCDHTKPGHQKPLSCYTNHRCHCPECRAANSNAHREWRERNQAG